MSFSPLELFLLLVAIIGPLKPTVILASAASSSGADPTAVRSVLLGLRAADDHRRPREGEARGSGPLPLAEHRHLSPGDSADVFTAHHLAGGRERRLRTAAALDRDDGFDHGRRLRLHAKLLGHRTRPQPAGDHRAGQDRRGHAGRSRGRAHVRRAEQLGRRFDRGTEGVRLAPAARTPFTFPGGWIMARETVAIVVQV